MYPVESVECRSVSEMSRRGKVFGTSPKSQRRKRLTMSGVTASTGDVADVLAPDLCTICGGEVYEICTKG